MRCPRCQFENIPGQDRCLRCGSILDVKNAVIDIHPPRMPPWKGPMRMVLRWLRLQRTIPEAVPRPRVPDFLKIMSEHALFGCILSIIPGLAHYVDGRFREVRWFVLVWFLSLTAGIFIYGSNPGLLLLGLAVGIHSWIAYNYAFSKELNEPSEKIRTLIVMLFVLGIIYTGIRNTVFRGFVFGYADMTIPYQNIKAGDLLLARRGLTQAAKLNRGDIVLAPVAGDIYGGYGHQGQALRQGPIMASEIVGLTGEQVEIVNSSFVVDGKTLDAKKYPVPEWLRGNNIGPISVPDASFFVSTVYNVNGHGVVLNAGLVGQACMVRSYDIEAKAVIRWFPLARRGFLKEGE
ncbi:MAG: hypothetical protein ABSB25_09100 [Sedimentisphaerales bacterium]